MGAGGPLHVLGRHGADPIREAGHIVQGKPQKQALGELAGHLTGGLQAEGKASREVVPGRIQLLGRHRLVAKTIKLVEEFNEGGVGHVGPHLGDGPDDPDIGGSGDLRVGSVRPTPLFPEDLEEPGVSPAAQNPVHHGEREEIGVIRRHAQMAHTEDRLNRTRAVHEVDPRFVPLRRRHEGGKGPFGPMPIAEELPDTSFHLVRVDAAGDEEEGTACVDHIVAEGDQFIAGDGFHRCRGRRPAIGMILPIDHGVEAPLGHGLGLPKLGLEPGQGLAPGQLHLVIGEGGVEGHVLQ